MQDRTAHPVLPPTNDQTFAARLFAHVEALADRIGPRNIRHYEALQQAADYCDASLRLMGYTPLIQTYEARSKTFANLAVEIPGTTRKHEIVVVGAHYDTHKNSPGANDNGSAIAALLELARHFAAIRPHRTLRLVAFTNEESPFTRTRHMGSRVYARTCRERGDNIVAMLGLEMLGCYSEEIGSQRLSFRGMLLPRKGNFLALVGNRKSKPLLSQVSGLFAAETSLHTACVTLPTHFPGAWSSDHWSFWREGYPAVMATDTGPLRHRQYHSQNDTPDKLNLEWLARVTEGLKCVVAGLVRPNESNSPT